jgi:Mrp family chromosome partitioning ATPase
MTSEAEIRSALERMEVPMLKRSIGSLNLLRSVNCGGSRVDVEMAAPVLNEMARDVFRVQIGRELKKIPGVEEVEVTFTSSKPADLNAVKNVIAVMSGKGGVGKSSVTSLMAVSLRRAGYSVGILDADITGPSIPRIFGLSDKPICDSAGMMPVITSSGIAVMSINLVLENDDDAVIWRGPLIAKAITQFWEEVYWGNLDYLIVDLPPGTADAPLTVIKSLPVSGLVMVTTPQELASMIVRKAVSMARSTGTHIIGVVENMSYLYLADIDRRIEVFGPGRGRELAETAGVPLLARIPIDSNLTLLCDTGRIEDCQLEAIAQLGAVANVLAGK